MAQDARNAAQPNTILRVKRKRNEDRIDAFVYQMNLQGTKRRIENEERDIGMFRLAQTVPDPANSYKNKRIIDAEWDAERRKIAIKRKRDEFTENDARKKHLIEKTEKMDHFAEMLADYLQCTSLTYPVNNGEKNTESDFVYDIYYRETMPTHWQLPGPSTPARPGPPTVGRAKTKPKEPYSPVPLAKHQHSTTSAPGFEHLANLHSSNPEATAEEWEEDDFIPVFLRSSVDQDGRMTVVPISSTGQRLAETLLVDEELRAPPSMLGEDEDSNDEDFYANDYPDQDEWDESGEFSD